MKQSIRQYAPESSPAGSSGPENGETGSDPENNDDTNQQESGLYQGGQVTTGTPYDGDYGKPEPNREATTEDEEDQ